MNRTDGAACSCRESAETRELGANEGAHFAPDYAPKKLKGVFQVRVS
ncbi:MAG TPA: hypothetical protein VME69_15485 [Methylocella sp.]|nr:hypothetical protein [Methylocella sp.]